jgi:hypothetical protein
MCTRSSASVPASDVVESTTSLTRALALEVTVAMVGGGLCHTQWQLHVKIKDLSETQHDTDESRQTASASRAAELVLNTSKLILSLRTGTHNMATKQEIARLPPDVNKIIFVKCVCCVCVLFVWCFFFVVSNGITGHWPLPAGCALIHNVVVRFFAVVWDGVTEICHTKYQPMNYTTYLASLVPFDRSECTARICFCVCERL